MEQHEEVCRQGEEQGQGGAAVFPAFVFSVLQIPICALLCSQILGTKLTDEELKQREDTLVLLETLIRDMEAMFYKEKSGRNDNNRLASKAKAELDAERTGLNELLRLRCLSTLCNHCLNCCCYGRALLTHSQRGQLVARVAKVPLFFGSQLQTQTLISGSGVFFRRRDRRTRR